MTGDQAVARVRTEAGTDLDVATTKVYLQDRLYQLVADARWRMAEVALGTTTADDRTYALPTTVVDLDTIFVTAASDGDITEYRRVGQPDLIGLRTGRLVLSGSGGVFAPNAETDGDVLVELYPAPELTGDTITGYGAIHAAAISDWTVEVTAVPVDVHAAWVAGAISDVLAVGDERSDSAQWFEAQFQEGVAKLVRRKNSRLGGGAQRAQVYGYDFV